MLLMAVQFWLAGLRFLASPSVSGPPLPSLGVVDGAISAIRFHKETVFLGGEFHYAGPQEWRCGGSRGPTWHRLPQFPLIDGTVLPSNPTVGAAGLSEGNSNAWMGWAVTNLIHVTSDQRVGPRLEHRDGWHGGLCPGRGRRA
jgi:hypothetical protein